ncbi:hypothetical protein [Fibrella forsythiae]|uniref:DUF1835 domain-containing protein n=1 Tax=Fibrella forsythiae TaxID=2817061 RepID=A0ABS3JCI5_9BACT|nr:hypothetical protein [Fibrella forsythiae]MBO0947703.1 hypothetical protein [Fibrella forsythiae]
MTYHLLNGDALLDRFTATKLEGQVLVARECLIEGDVSGNSLADFWNSRAASIESAYHESSATYFRRVVGEFDKLLAAQDQSDVHLWFGYDLFCQVNMWFVLSLLYNQPRTFNVFAVYPSHLNSDAIWNDFGGATVADLLSCFASKVAFSNADIQLGNNLWNAYRQHDLVKLAELSITHSPCFPYLNEVCRAHIERFGSHGEKGRPERVVEAIISGGTTDFPAVFRAFTQREGIYGFGDSQLKPLYDNVMAR